LNHIGTFKKENAKDDLENQFPHLPERIFGLMDPAYNLWWSWHPNARMLFKSLDHLAWKAISQINILGKSYYASRRGEGYAGQGPYRS